MLRVMSHFPVNPHAQGLTVVIGWPHHEPVLELVARLALAGPARVLVGGNRFDARQLARVIRRHTTRLDETLGRIELARPFTCYQVIALLEQTTGDVPLIFLDMLATFYDDAVQPAESVRLARTAVSHLQRCQQQAPVLVTLRPTPPAAGFDLSPLIQAVADQVYIYSPPPAARQASLFTENETGP